MESDRLLELWHRQEEYCKKINYGTNEEGTKELALHVVSELDELLREISWKTHRRQKKTVIRANILEEIIDLQKFIWSIAVLWQFTDQDIYEEFKRKSDVVEQLYHQEIQLDNLDKFDKIVGVDIDGVIADYPKCFFEYLRQSGWHIDESVKSTKQLVADGYMSVVNYEQSKDSYRQSGRKRYLPLMSGAKEMLQWLRDKNYGVVLLTSRPYKKYKRLFADTLEWLSSNQLVYDAILFDEEKNIRLYREFGDRVKFFVEDELDKAEDIAKMGIKVYLLNNENKALSHGIVKINSLDDVKKLESDNAK